MLTDFSYNKGEFFEELRAKDQDILNTYLEIAELTSNMENIIEIISEIDSSNNRADFLNILLKKSLNLIPEADYARAYLFNYRGEYFSETIYKEKVKLISEIEENKYLQNSSEYIVFKENISSKKLKIKLEIEQELLGAVVLYIAANNQNKFTNNSKKIALSLEKLAASYLKINRYQKIQEKFTEEIINSLTNLLGIHDKYTKGHNQNVANISRRIASYLDLSSKEIQKAYWTGILHDIGKIVVPAEILNKKSRLTAAEYEKVKKHPEWGYKTLKNHLQLKEIADYVLHHHERWDGRGYPAGLKGAEIPLISRIVSIADAWDSMRSDRAYRKALTEEKALVEMIKNKGKQFDSALVDLFLEKIIKIH